MIVSHKRKFIFIHIPKTGGGSIRRTLLPHADIITAKDAKTDHAKKFKRLINNNMTVKNMSIHAKPKVVQNLVGRKVWANYFKFCFVRNPWDLMVSLYYFNRRPDYGKTEVGRFAKRHNFTDFITWFVRTRKNKKGGIITKGQLPYILNNNGKLLINYVGRFENLVNEFGNITNKLGIKEKLMHSNRTSHKPYREYYDDRTCELVAYFFKRDIEYFNFEF